MPFTGGPLQVRQVDERVWELTSPLGYTARRDVFTIPAGFRTDFASVPRAVIWLVPRYGVYTRAAVLHDYLCDVAPVDRADADGLFRRVLGELGVSVPRRWMMWAAVRAGSAMRGADAGQWLAFLLVAPPALAFVAVPAITVQVALGVFWLVEQAFWVGGRLAGGREPRPRLQLWT